MQIPRPNDTQFELTPAGTFLAVCFRVIDLGTQTSTWQGQPKKQHKVLVSWELPQEPMADGRPFTISQFYTWSMSEKARLRHDLESWRGTPFTEADFAGGFDIKNIIGKACLLTIVHTEKNSEGKQYANITAVSKLMKGMTAPQPTNEKAYLWIAGNLWSEDVFSKLSDNLKQKILSSPEYAEMNGRSHDDEPQPLEAEEAIPF